MVDAVAFGEDVFAGPLDNAGDHVAEVFLALSGVFQPDAVKDRRLTSSLALAPSSWPPKM